ncbi:hypothetical protein SE17_10730 [Kouleothrix aurantiaca]|uniref:Uncharacterized protein n=1 Tax=Kouleothrix aurantiaca TaxID=186479 RepID=A0A0P9D2L4_9CHLR|nr:hypothetical protein SE17_10730 [Kouleothrix aurantiaca]
MADVDQATNIASSQNRAVLYCRLIINNYTWTDNSTRAKFGIVTYKASFANTERRRQTCAWMNDCV